MTVGTEKGTPQWALGNWFGEQLQRIEFKLNGETVQEISEIDDLDELELAIDRLAEHGYLANKEQVLGGSFFVSVTDLGVEVFWG